MQSHIHIHTHTHPQRHTQHRHTEHTDPQTHTCAHKRTQTQTRNNIPTHTNTHKHTHIDTQIMDNSDIRQIVWNAICHVGRLTLCSREKPLCPWLEDISCRHSSLTPPSPLLPPREEQGGGVSRSNELHLELINLSSLSASPCRCVRSKAEVRRSLGQSAVSGRARAAGRGRPRQSQRWGAL